MRKKKGILITAVLACVVALGGRLCPGGTDREKRSGAGNKGGTDDTSGT